MSRFIIAVMDSVGIGALPDAAAYNSQGANTLGHIAQGCKLNLPHLARLGLGNIAPLRGVGPADHPSGAWGKMASRTAGKDTTSGHWEIAGLLLPQPLPTYPQGFPEEVITAFTQAIGHPVLGNWLPAAPSSTPQRTACFRSPAMSRSTRRSSCMKCAASPGRYCKAPMAWAG